MAQIADVHPVARSAGLPLDIRPVGGRIGAEIAGLGLTGDLDRATVDAIRDALVGYKAVFFRDQHHFDADVQQAFAALLGKPYRHPTVPGSGASSVTELEAAEGYSAASWHTDVTFAAEYPRYTILFGVHVPESGGDTLWADTASAYQGLPEEFRRMVDGLWAYHDNRFDYAGGGTAMVESGYRKAFSSVFIQTEHPVVHVHPDSGERHLLGGSYLKRFRGFNDSDSNHLRAILQDHVTNPDNTVRWRWRNGDVVIWDNAATQHRAVADFGAQRRSLRKATAGSITPVSIDGTPSKVISGIE
jgi:alpha-ketoglutarate-dependent sulfate ester dioxygenase